MSYPPIAEHGLIGDLQTAALGATDGTIDWFRCPASTRRACSRRCSTTARAQGSFPQVFTHLALIAAVLDLDPELDHPEATAIRRLATTTDRG